MVEMSVATGLIVWNGYLASGHTASETYTLASVLADWLGNPGISKLCMCNTLSGHPYINESGAYYVGSGLCTTEFDLCWQLVSDVTCHACQKLIAGDIYSSRWYKYCMVCYTNAQFTCLGCGITYHSDNMGTIRNYCSSCATPRMCEQCHTYVPRYQMAYVSGSVYGNPQHMCANCRALYATHCEVCNILFDTRNGARTQRRCVYHQELS
jgi:hypothetical protein